MGAFAFSETDGSVGIGAAELVLWGAVAAAAACAVVVLREGGSAVDAAVAAAAVCTVTQPHRTGIGGDLFALVYDARTREVQAYNGSGAAPSALDLDSFPDGYPKSGPRVATVPGVLAAFADLMDDHGRLGLERALAPAIQYAEEGFPVSDGLAEGFVDSGARLDEECARVFGPRGRFPRSGEILQQTDLAQTLREVVAHGVAAFYGGDLGARFADAVATLGGHIALDDLGAHSTDRPEPIAVPYRGLRVFGQPPVPPGHVLLEELAIAEGEFTEFGAACRVPDTGIMLNDRLTGFSLDAASPNALAPGKRPIHTLNTVMALEGVTPRLVFGTPGRHAQVQTNFQLAVALIDHGMEVQRAIEEPRWYHESGRALKIENRFSEQTRTRLAAKGHEIALVGDWAEVTGGAQAIAIDENGVFSGGADPRREGNAAGY